ncbi:MAG: FHA domain-containing protein [Planctomycetota bacterium]|nr:MAG: FHA domain-containing protein [Planctomycetota bacterium]
MTARILHVLTGKSKGKRVKLNEGESIIGRDESAQIRLATSEISRQHCLLMPTADGVLVRDLGSRNGTFINGHPIAEETLLKPGDHLSVGPMTFELEGGESSSKESAPARARKPKNDPKLSDDDIAGWLTGDSGELPTSDTTILSGRPVTSAAAPSTPPKPPRKEFKSVAEEAQDIIQRFVESQKEAE